MVFTNDYSTENGADVTESTLKQQTTSVTTSPPVFSEPPEDQENNVSRDLTELILSRPTTKIVFQTVANLTVRIIMIQNPTVRE